MIQIRHRRISLISIIIILIHGSDIPSRDRGHVVWRLESAGGSTNVSIHPINLQHSEAGESREGKGEEEILPHEKSARLVLHGVYDSVSNHGCRGSFLTERNSSLFVDVADDDFDRSEFFGGGEFGACGGA